MRRLAFVIGLGLTLFVAGNAWVLVGGRGAAPQHASAALVLGAKVYPSGALSGMLEDRVQVAVGLYRAGRVDKLLLSGDHGTLGYDEVGAMRDRVLQLGVPPEDVFTDHAGFDTWDSVVRARKVFAVRDAIVVTQRFHLARAVWLARRAGLRAGGIAADRGHDYGRLGRVAKLRETLARIKALPDGVLHRSPRFLGPTIAITGDGRRSWG